MPDAPNDRWNTQHFDQTSAGRADDDRAAQSNGRGGPVLLPKPFEPTVYRLPDAETIPRRGWLHGMHYMRKVPTATVAPGGTGKTTLALFEALSMVKMGLRVWYISGEDDRDEIDRRIAAHCALHGTPPFGDNLLIDDKQSFAFKIARSGRTGPEFDNEKLDSVESAIKRHRIDVVIFDPFISFHTLSENDTTAMDALIKRLGDVAIRCDCSIELSHHVRKPSFGQTELTVYDARGAGAIVNAVRSCRVINQMTEAEAQLIKVPDKPARYIRVDSGKRNMAPAEKAVWFHLVSIKIANGDNVQALEPFEFKPEQITPEDDDWLILTMTSGATFRAYSQSPEWLGLAVAEHFGRDPKLKGDVMWINRQLKTWQEHAPHRPYQLLRTVERDDKDRKPRKFFELTEEALNGRAKTSVGQAGE